MPTQLPTIESISTTKVAQYHMQLDWKEYKNVVVHKFSKKSRRPSKFWVSKVIWNKFHTQDPQILSSLKQNVVMQVT